MKFPYCPTIGFIRDMEVELEASLEWEEGEPRVVIDGVYVGKHNLIINDDPLTRDLGLRIADMAEDDDSLTSKVMEQEARWTGNGSNDPSGRFVVPA